MVHTWLFTFKFSLCQSNSIEHRREEQEMSPGEGERGILRKIERILS